MKTYREMREWIDAQDPYNERGEKECFTTPLGVFDKVLAELAESIDGGWGLSDRDVVRLWELRERFLELEHQLPGSSEWTDLQIFTRLHTQMPQYRGIPERGPFGSEEEAWSGWYMVCEVYYDQGWWAIVSSSTTTTLLEEGK